MLLFIIPEKPLIADNMLPAMFQDRQFVAAQTKSGIQQFSTNPLF